MVKYGQIAHNNPSKITADSFSVGSLEVKASWIDVKALGDSSSYYVTDAKINGVKSKVALLGMHVVGVVENHPEFVWATFEHDNLAPNYDWGKATPTTDAPVTSESNYLLFNKNATASVENITSGKNKNTDYTNVFSVNKYGVPVEKAIKGSFDVQLFMETSQNGSENFNNIRTINESVKKQLTGTWNNYFYNGSIWINTEGLDHKEQVAKLNSLSYNLSSSKKGDLTRGSVAAYNITMETYVQVGFVPKSIHQQSVGTMVNCFSCHNAANGKDQSPLYISHLFNGYLSSLKGLTKEQIKKNTVDEIKEHFLKRQNK
jgi:hypothetical protein